MRALFDGGRGVIWRGITGNCVSTSSGTGKAVAHGDHSAEARAAQRTNAGGFPGATPLHPARS